MNKKRKPKAQQTDPSINFESYFKIGVSPEFILLRDDFPICAIAPGDFARLTREMFRKNEEALHGKE